MEYSNVRTGIFIERPNRFLAKVEIDGKKEIVHVKNTGRCRELFVNGADVILEKSDNSARKTEYSLIAVYKNGRIFNVDSQAPNNVAAEALSGGKIDEIGNVDYIKREKVFGESRFDVYFERGIKKGFVEVKGVTLEKDGVAMFPDAPTQRGTKHINGLIEAAERGYEAGILFVVQTGGIYKFVPNFNADPDFCKALKKASKHNVKIMAYGCDVSTCGIEIAYKIDVELCQ